MQEVGIISYVCNTQRPVFFTLFGLLNHDDSGLLKRPPIKPIFNFFFFGNAWPEKESTNVFRTVDTAQGHRRLGSFTTPLREPKNVHDITCFKY